MSFTSPEFILGIFGALGLGGFGVALLTLRPSRRKLTGEATKLFEEAKKQGADSAAVITSTAISLLGPMKIEITDLKSEVDKLTAKLKETTEKLEEANTNLEEASRIILDLRMEANQLKRERDVYRRIHNEHYGHPEDSQLEIEAGNNND